MNLMSEQPRRNRLLSKAHFLLFAVTFLIVTPFLWHTLRLSQAGMEAGLELPPPAAQGQRPVLTEFGDFQCPYCAKFTDEILSRLREDFIHSGHLDFEYRHYIILGPGSYHAALASECARDQMAFSSYHDAVFDQLTSQGRGFTVNALKDLAHKHKLNMPRFNLCLDSEWHLSRLQRDLELARKLEVNATPTLFLDGQRVSWVDYEALSEDILKKLRGGGR